MIIMKKIEKIPLIITLTLFLTSVYLYSEMPEQMAAHWDYNGKIDYYMPKIIVLFLMPLLLSILNIFFIVMPVKTLKSENYYNTFIILTFLFLAAIHFQLMLWNIGIHFPPNISFPIGVGFLIYYSGMLLENVKRNNFIGIRFPWTLRNEKVWRRTHKFGGKLFKIAGIIIFVSVIFPEYTIIIMMLTMLITMAVIIIYSKRLINKI